MGKPTEDAGAKTENEVAPVAQAAAEIAPAITDPATAGIDHLRAAGTEPLRLWGIKGPKEIGGTISAVFLQATSEIVLLQQLPSGKFVVFKKEVS